MPRPSAAVLVPSRQPITRLKIAIVKSGFPQRVIAARLRISPFRLSRIVRGRQDPTPDEQDRLAELLDEPRRVLFKVVALLTVWSAL
jgi:transcriptional regulator with XRE-family HTH domain